MGIAEGQKLSMGGGGAYTKSAIHIIVRTFALLLFYGMFLEIVMTQEEKFAYWVQLAQYDLETAGSMLSSGRWFYVAFMCQQAIEKLCKGLYNFYIDDDVPKVHNIRFILSKLENPLSITMSSDVYNFIDSLSAYYLTNRYPDFITKPSVQIDKNTAEKILEKTREVYAWLLTLKR